MSDWKQYTKKPIVVEAREADPAGEMLYGPNGMIRAEPGDMIVKGVNGELFTLKPNIFKAAYEAVTKDDQ